MSDEQWLSGFLDGELDPEQQKRAEAMIAGDAALRQRLALMQRTDALIRSAGATLAGSDTPARFMHAIDAGLERQEVDRHKLERRAASAGNDNSPARWRFGAAIAASLAAGLFLGTQLARSGGDTSVTAALAQGLESVPSGQSITLASGDRLTPRLTFAAKDGEFCRQYVLEAPAGNRVGLACRSGDGWDVEALIPQDAIPSARQGYAVAEGSSGTAIDALTADLRIGDPLGPTAEARLIDSRWRRP